MNAIATTKCEGAGKEREPGKSDCAQTGGGLRDGTASQRLQYQLQDDLVRSWLVGLKRERAARSRMKWVLLGLMLVFLVVLAVRASQ